MTPRTLYAASGSVYRTTNGGTTWLPASAGIAGAVVSLALATSQPSTLYAGTTDLVKGKPVFNYNMLILAQYRWEGPAVLTPGKHTIVFDYTYDGPGIAKGGGGALIQITGGSSRRAIPGKGLWAAGAFATRALVQAAAQELRQSGIHVALLAVDATIESPKTADFTGDVPREALGDMGQVAAAVSFLVEQESRAFSHELVVTPAGERWVP